MVLLKLDWTQVAQCRMSSMPIVETLNVSEDVTFGLVRRIVFATMNQLGLNGTEETFHGGVIVGISLATHTRLDAMVGQQRLVFIAGILAATVRMMQQPGTRRRSAGLERHLERRSYQVSGRGRIHRPAHNSAREQVKHRCQEEPSLTGPHVGDIRHPLLC